MKRKSKSTTEKPVKGKPSEALLDAQAEADKQKEIAKEFHRKLEAAEAELSKLKNGAVASTDQGSADHVSLLTSVLERLEALEDSPEKNEALQHVKYALGVFALPAKAEVETPEN